MKRVLFVDDEAQILEGFRDLLRRHRNKWDLVFALGAAAGLAEVEKGSRFDVVVSDMRMPGMDGAALLARVRERDPTTVRVILSGFTDEEGMLRTIGVAHRVLAKPCDSATLVAVIEGVEEATVDDRVRRMVLGLEVPPSPPRAWARLGELMANPECTARQIVAELESDPGISLKVLQLVNSAFFGLPQPVTSLARAVTFLGNRTLLATVLAVEAFQVGPGVSPRLVNEVQRHGIWAGRIARQLDPPSRDEAYVASLLQDVGRLVLAASTGKTYDRVVHRAGSGSLAAAEFEEYGMTHAEVGGYLLRTWGLPGPLCDAVAASHTPRPEAAWDLASATCAAGALAAWAAHKTESPPIGARVLGIPERFPTWREIAASVTTS